MLASAVLAAAAWALGSVVLGSAVLGSAVLSAPAPSQAQAAVDAGAPQVVSTRVVRPPEGSMRRGALPVPEWAVWVGASVVILGAALGLGYRLGRSKR